ncbi:MAG: Sjogren's syndrome/scleroderma autoantigen 1 family protein [Halobacteriales archaeon]
MSDDFDREAERERLREKFEAEEEDREATQRMSDLLLKGATMTNVHCDECGDPIFRYEGQEFCPTCQRTVGDAEGAEGTDAEGAGEGAEVEVETEPRTDDGGNAEPETAPTEPSEGSEDGPTAVERPDRTAATRGDAPAAGGDLGAARESLVRTLADLAERAEATDDAGRARQLLSAAREAAEAIAAIDRTGH